MRRSCFESPGRCSSLGLSQHHGYSFLTACQQGRQGRLGGSPTAARSSLLDGAGAAEDVQALRAGEVVAVAVVDDHKVKAAGEPGVVHPPASLGEQGRC